MTTRLERRREHLEGILEFARNELDLARADRAADPRMVEGWQRTVEDLLLDLAALEASR